MRVLVVTSPFGDHTRGSKITDPAEIDAVLAGENASHVVQSDHPDETPVKGKAKSAAE